LKGRVAVALSLAAAGAWFALIRAQFSGSCNAAVKSDVERRVSRAITIVVLTCFLVLGAATTAILGRDSVPDAGAMMLTEPAAKPVAANRASKADRLSVPTLALASASIEPMQSPVLTEPLRQAFAAATPADFPMPRSKSSASMSSASMSSASEAPVADAPVATETTPASKPKVVAKPQPQKTYSLLSDGQIAGIKDRLRLSSSQEYYWPSVESALRNVARKIQANKLSNPQVQGVQIDPDCQEVQQLKSAAMPLLFQLRDDQKEEVRKLARIIGLEKVAQQI
jgi:hypothetical protein